MHTLALVLFTACTVPQPTASTADALGEAVPPDATLPPPTPLTLSGPDFVPVSSAYALHVEGVYEGELAFFLAGATEGEGPCHRRIGGHCLDLETPVDLVGASAESEGSVSLDLVSDPWPFVETCFQAVIMRGPSGIHSGLSNIHCINYCPDEDVDEDGICDAFDPCEGPGTDDADADGWCDSVDPCEGPGRDDADDDGFCDTIDPCDGPGTDDADADGVCDSIDPCPADPLDTDSDSDGICDVLDPCPLDASDDSDGDGTCDSDDPCPDDPFDACAGCSPSGARAPFDTLSVNTAAGCWDGNVCGRDLYGWDSIGQNFTGFGEQISCTGATTCVSNVGITTYNGSTTVCQGSFDVLCDGVWVGNINTLGRTCDGSAMSNGCSVAFEPLECSEILLEAVEDGDGTSGCCGSPQPDSMITAVSAW